MNTTRAGLITAVYATVHGGDEWVAAVKALGRFSRNPPKARKPTGRDYWQTIWQITKSHHFTEEERATYRERAQYEHGSEPLYAEVTGLAATRAAAERQLKKAQKAAPLR